MLTWPRACPKILLLETLDASCAAASLEYSTLSWEALIHVSVCTITLKEEVRMWHEERVCFDPLQTDTSTYMSWWVLAYLVLLKALFSWTNYNNKERVL